jgi:hypothetical protein
MAKRASRVFSKRANSYFHGGLVNSAHGVDLHEAVI